MTTSKRSQFEVFTTTNPSDFGYGNKPAPTNEQLATGTPDYRGPVMASAKHISETLNKLGTTYSRTVVRECATGRVMSRDEFNAIVDDLRY